LLRWPLLAVDNICKRSTPIAGNNAALLVGLFLHRLLAFRAADAAVSGFLGSLGLDGLERKVLRRSSVSLAAKTPRLTTKETRIRFQTAAR
jgi:hypothetical protein